MALSNQIRGSEPADLQAVGRWLAHWPWRLLLSLLVVFALALFAAKHPLVVSWALFIGLSWLFVAGAAEGPEDVRRIGTRGR